MSQQKQEAPLPSEPRVDMRATTTTWHGVTLTDEYSWLRDDNWQTRSEEHTYELQSH